MADPLSDVLNLLEARSVLSTGLAAGGDWCVRVAGYAGLKFNAMLRGSAWLMVEGIHEAVWLEQGDCFMLSGGAPFVLASNLDLPQLDAADVFADAADGMARIGVGDEVVIAGGKMTLVDASAALLTDVLPPLVHLSALTARARTVRWLLERFALEVGSEAPGSQAQATHAMHMIFIELIRLRLKSRDATPPGWLCAMADPRIGRALEAIHREPRRDWTLPELASEAHLSRSGFALRFKQTVGNSPLDYLLRWRMHLAARALQQQRVTVASVAEDMGYDSESAFGRAFKRVFGCSPRAYAPKRNALNDHAAD